MKDTFTMHHLESINEDLFSAIDLDEETWAGGAASRGTVSGSVTYNGGHADGGGDVDFSF